MKLSALVFAVILSSAGKMEAAPSELTAPGIVPGDGKDDAPAIRRALQEQAEVDLPSGIFDLGSTVYVPSGRKLRGVGMSATQFRLGADTVAFRVEGQRDVLLAGFAIDCSGFDNSVNEAIRVYARKPPADSPCRVQVSDVRILKRRSRAPAISFSHAEDCAVRHCEAVDNTRLIWAAPDGIAPGDPPMAWQVYGSGITFSHSRNVVVEHNRIVETDAHLAIMSAPPPPRYRRYFQGSAIQVVACTDAVIQYNRVKGTGQGIDSNRTDGALIRGNILENCQSHGLKLAHFARRQRLVGNWIQYAGAQGIALAPGNDEPTSECTVEDNVFVGIGKGMGEGWWDATGQADYPACIHLDQAKTPGRGSHDCVIRNNISYDNDKLSKRIQNPVVVVRAAGKPLGAYHLTLENNRLASGPAPEPPPIPADAGKQNPAP